jgi:thiosulfate/3-mercaptopyruvate sulfurtransferase
VEPPNVDISATELRTLLAGDSDVVLLDVRRTAAGHQGAAGHLPGAHLAEMPAQLAGPRHPLSGNNPLPSEERIQSEAIRWGITDQSLVVVYSPDSPSLATRAWWILKWAGVPDVRYLDGGVDAWVAAGGELTSDSPAEGNGTFKVRVGALPVLDADGAAATARHGLLLDARSASAYTGEPVSDTSAPQGHIPGALSAPSSANLDGNGLLKTADELRVQYAALGAARAEQVGVYCGGVGATFDILALAKAGISAALFPGSWSAWSADPARPVATGPEPG